MPSIAEEMKNQAALMQSIDLLTKKLTKEKMKSDAMRRALIRISGEAAGTNPSSSKCLMYASKGLLEDDRIEKTGKL